MDLKEIDILGESINHHWYYASKAKAMLNYLGKSEPAIILDVGAGSGFFSRYLLNRTDAGEAWCVDISYESEYDERLAEKTIFYRKSVESVQADLVLFMDVLEHVDNDVALLDEYVPKVPVNSHFLITVPAFSFLWSSHDVYLEHRRRYTVSQLEKTVQDAGLKVVQSGYYFGMVFPIAASIRLLQNCFGKNEKAASQLSRHNFFTNGMLKALCSIELPFMKINKLAGLSVFCLAQKVN